MPPVQAGRERFVVLPMQGCAGGAQQEQQEGEQAKIGYATHGNFFDKKNKGTAGRSSLETHGIYPQKNQTFVLMRLHPTIALLFLAQLLSAQCVTFDPVPTQCSDIQTYQLSATPAGGLWSGNQISPAGLVTLRGLNGFQFATYIYSDSTCTDTVTVPFQVINGPALSAGTDFSIACGGTPRVNGAYAEGPNRYAYWSTSDGHLLDPPTDLNGRVSKPGTYILIAIDSTVGCPSRDTSICYPYLPSYPHTEIIDTICQGDTLLGYTTSGNFYTKYETGAPCDSFRVVRLTVLQPLRDTLAATTCAGETFEGYSQSGIYTDTFPAANGCDSIRTLNLTVLPTFATELNFTTCDPAQAGTLTLFLTAQNGCDSLVTTTVELLPTATSQISQTICAGETFEGYSQSGTYTDSFPAANGCDSIRTLNLTVLPTFATELNFTTCDPAQAGTLTLFLTAQNGCDSLVTTTVELLPTATSQISQTICAGETFEGYSQSGTFTDTFPAANGCDSIRTLNLLVQALPNAGAAIQPDQGTANGAIDIISLTGTAPFQLIWSTGDSTASLTGLSAGDYTLTLTDGTGCSAVFTFTVPMSVSAGAPEGDRVQLLAAPNPAPAGHPVQFSLEAPGHGAVQVSVFNAAGGLARSFTLQHAGDRSVFPLDFQSDGLYVVHVVDWMGRSRALRLVVW